MARVAQRVELREIHLAEIVASALPRTLRGPIEPTVAHDCTPMRRDGGHLEVSCDYRFTATVAGTQVAKAALKFVISYDLEGDAQFPDDDIKQFAFANGTYHSWPFVRQLLFDLTARMGYPPYTLPVFKFNPKPPKPPQHAAGEEQPAAGPAKTPVKSKKT